MREAIRVLIIDDHQLLGEGLALALKREADHVVVGIALSVADGIRLATEARPDVVLVDYHLPDGTIGDLAAGIRGSVPDASIVILTGDTSADALLDAIEAGACGFILKSQGLSVVIDAVRRAAEGEMLIPAPVVARLFGRQRERLTQGRERQRLLDQLTLREHEVLELMAQGLDTRVIAERLVVSYTTVRGYIQSVLEKLGAHSKLEAVVRAKTYGLLQQ